MEDRTAYSTIRRAEVHDLPRLVAIDKQCFRRDAYPLDVFTDMLDEQNGKSSFFVAVEREEIVGYIMASTVTKGRGNILSVAVVASHRRRGIGSRLLQAACDELAKKGAEQVRLEVRNGNGGAISFYKHMGFLRSRISKGYYKNGEDALVMTLQHPRLSQTDRVQ